MRNNKTDRVRQIDIGVITNEREERKLLVFQKRNTENTGRGSEIWWAMQR